MINLNHLKYFCDACRSKSLVRSAELNLVSHSAISQAIRNLERTLDVRLLHHAKKRFELTQEGEALFQQAYGLFEGFDKIFNLVRSDSNAPSGPLRLGFSHSLGAGIVNDRLNSFCAKYPLILPTISIGNSASLESLLESRKIDLGFGVEDGSLVRLEREALVTGRFVLVAGINQKTTNRFLVGDKGAEVLALRLALKKMKLDAQFVEIQSWSVIAELSGKGMGIGLVPEFILKARQAELIQIHEEIRLPRYQVCAFFRSRSALSSVARAFLKEISAATDS
ncbi:MAG: LysR family transcriptional regulator [Bdellovibrionales bacterium]|nr:LysR family transcriptional regulator [Bdellovibrionales bacterium]